MSVAWRLLGCVALALLLWPALPAYQANRGLAAATTRVERALRGVDRGDAARASLTIALNRVDTIAPSLGADPRLPLVQSIALILSGEYERAAEVLRAAIARGERPELTLNLGRALGARGDEPAAQAAFLRTAWASPSTIASLPAPLREQLHAQVQRLEDELRAGRLRMPPPLPKE